MRRSLLAVTVKPGTEADFLREFGEAKTFTIGFPDGDEEPWVAGKPAPTQPFGKAKPPASPARRDNGSI